MKYFKIELFKDNKRMGEAELGIEGEIYDLLTIETPIKDLDKVIITTTDGKRIKQTVESN